MRISNQSLGLIHFIGIGGIGMSGIAEILHSLGYGVRGSDLFDNANVKRLRGLGIPVVIGQKAENVEGASVVVVSSAIKAENEELKWARSLKIPVVKRAEMLAEIMHLSPCIAVAGTHGKTTTTSIGACVLDAGGLHPTVVSGGIINAYGTNARLGTGAWTIVEADESDGTFSKLPATIAIVTNIDPEHMEHYGSYDVLKSAFRTYLENIPFYGLAILCADHQATFEIAKGITDRRVLTYGIANESSDIRAVNLKSSPEGTTFEIHLSDHAHKTLKQKVDLLKKTDLFLPMVGEHNVSNALSIVVCALELGIDLSLVKEGLSEFFGVKRRFTRVGEANGMAFVDDYAHHPTEIKATLASAKQVCFQKVIAVVQPHRYSRLADLFEEFTHCFDQADHVVLTPVYAAGEQPDVLATHHTLAKALKEKGKSVYTVNAQDELPTLLTEVGSPRDMCVFMGAGDITAWCSSVVTKLKGTLVEQNVCPKKEQQKKSTQSQSQNKTGKLRDE